MGDRSDANPGELRLPIEAIERVVRSLVADELARLRRDRSFHASDLDEWRGEERLDGTAIGVDSLELVALATRVDEFFALRDTGLEDWMVRDRTIGRWAWVVDQSLRAESRTITFRTSGSTGEPKRCTHTLPCLSQEADGFVRLLDDAVRVVSLVPSHHMFGFIHGVLTPAASDIEVVDARHKLPASVGAMLRPGDRVIATPTQWGALLDAGVELPSEVTGVSSGAAMHQRTWSAVSDRGVRMTEVYGTSETGGVASRRSGKDPFELLPWLDAVPATPDNLEWVRDRRFIVRSRRDGSVQVAGVNVFPNRVAKVLKDVEGVREILVRKMTPDEGERLKAFVVLQPDAPRPDVLRSLEERARAELSDVERPVAWAFGSAAPADEMGKRRDWSVAA